MLKQDLQLYLYSGIARSKTKIVDMNSFVGIKPPKLEFVFYTHTHI